MFHHYAHHLATLAAAERHAGSLTFCRAAWVLLLLLTACRPGTLSKLSPSEKPSSAETQRIDMACWVLASSEA